MASAPVKTFPVLTLSEYLARESSAEYKSEFYYGHVYAMAGGSIDHHLIAGATYFQLAKLLRKSNCLVLVSDARIETANSNSVFYADASVHRGQEMQRKNLSSTSPTLVVEVLSPSTRKYDLTTKRKEYFRIPSLRHYLLLDSESITALLFTRGANQTWPKDPQSFTDPKDHIPLSTLGIQLKLRDLYRQTSLLPTSRPNQLL